MTAILEWATASPWWAFFMFLVAMTQKLNADYAKAKERLGK